MIETEFLSSSELLIVAVAEPTSSTPPPNALSASVLPGDSGYGATSECDRFSELPSIAVPSTTREPLSSTTMPPPHASIPLARLLVTWLSITVIVPQSSIPPPAPSEVWHIVFAAQVATTLVTVCDGTALLSVTTLFSIVTSVPGNVSIPPPSAVAVV